MLIFIQKFYSFTACNGLVLLQCPEWGFSRLQNQGCRFLLHAKISSHHEEIFEADILNFSKTLVIKCSTKRWVLTKMAKILRLQKIFLIMQIFLHDAAKITFCSLKRLGSNHTDENFDSFIHYFIFSQFQRQRHQNYKRRWKSKDKYKVQNICFIEKFLKMAPKILGSV